MSNQESMFADQEQQPYNPRPINTDPREQSAEQRRVPPQQERYGGEGSQQWDGGKIHPQRSHRRGPRVLLALVLLIVVLLGGLTAYGFIASSATPATVTSRTFSINHPTLIMNIGSGAIHVRTGTGTGVIVKETKRSSGFMSSSARVNYNQSGNTLTVQEDNNSTISFGFNSLDLDVTLPAASDLQLQTGSGSIDVNGINGQVSAQTGSGSVNASNLSGQQVTLKTGSGSIDANNISDQQELLSTGSGSITINGLSGQLNADTGSGAITISQGSLSGTSVVKTGSSSVTYNGSLAPNGNYRFETGSGSVDLTLPSSSAFSLHAQSDSGTVNNAFGSNEVGSNPRSSLSISTGSGSININKG